MFGEGALRKRCLGDEWPAISYPPRGKGADFPVPHMFRSTAGAHARRPCEMVVPLEASFMSPLTKPVESVTHSNWEPQNVAPGVLWAVF